MVRLAIAAATTTMGSNEKHYLELAAAFVRGRRDDAPDLDDEALFVWGLEQGMRLHKFKRKATLPRVRRVIGMLRGMAPDSLVDVGSGRGAFLWPLLDELPAIAVTAVDRSEIRARDVMAVAVGGIDRLTGLCADACDLPLADDAAEIVTMLEVLEHLEDPARAAAEAVRVARRFVIASVPSHEDDNPEHIQLFDGASLKTLFAAAGARRVELEHVRGHLLAVARVP
jgi:ubiquinone/menaquinone biosynthesis C-methylase UbiE